MKKLLVGLLVLAVVALLPWDAWTQKPAGVRVVGVLLASGGPVWRSQKLPKSEFFQAFVDALARNGYVEGKNLAFEIRGGDYEVQPALARELEQLRADAIWVLGTRSARIVQEVVKRTPLVVYSCDPFEHVSSLRHPGGNVTGTTCMTTELSPKRLALLKELVPTARRVVFFGDPDDAPLGWRLTRDAAPGLGLSIELVPYGNREGIPAALERIAQLKPDAVFVYPDVILGGETRRLARFWLEHSLPSMNAFPLYAETGALMSYGAIDGEVSSMMGTQAARILDGVLPGDIPLQRATRFHLVINLQTARSLGVKVPQSLLVQADRLIE